MSKETVTAERLDNGLSIIIEEMPHVQSAAYDLLIPGGIVSDAEGLVGNSLIAAELTGRGAAGLSSRQISDAFESLGARHSVSCGHERYVYHGALLAQHLDECLALVAKMVLAPTLPEEEIPNIKSILLQDIDALDDNPSRRAMIELSQRYYPAPYSRSSLGTKEGIQAATPATLRSAWEQAFHPGGAILSIAGNVKAPEVLASVRKLFGKWRGNGIKLPEFGAMPALGRYHIQVESAQEQIVINYPSAKFLEPHYYTSKVASGVLSGGMFGRLFIEVREKRGLCYSVYARHSSNNHYGTMTVYGGTTPQRADETLAVILEELEKLHGTVTAEELARAKANLKATLIIGEESSGSRASSNAVDWWLKGRVRGLDEIEREIEKVSNADIDNFLETYPARPFTLLTLGSKELP